MRQAFNTLFLRSYAFHFTLNQLQKEIIPMIEDTLHILKSKIEEKKELSEKINTNPSGNEEIDINAKITVLEAEIDTLLKKYILHVE
ncbi:hypothetical protein [uncultured Sulfuricurvum sp.]|uniref:hypothetical protein n=2 Tax=Sulfuricurvum TaxID=286130 RepID=UPI0026180FD3|nr:hypothetical protein [uncultured Sulfuricurvum sp.]